MDPLHYHKSRCSICLCFTLPLFLLQYTNGQCWWVAKGWHSTSEPARALTKPCSATSNCYLQPPFMPAVAAGYGARRTCHWSVSPKPASPALSCRGELEKSRGRKDWASLWWQLLSVWRGSQHIYNIHQVLLKESVHSGSYAVIRMASAVQTHRWEASKACYFHSSLKPPGFRLLTLC